MTPDASAGRLAKQAPDHYPGAYASRIADVASVPEVAEQFGGQAGWVIWMASRDCNCQCDLDCDAGHCDCEDGYICLSCDARDALGMMD